PIVVTASLAFGVMLMAEKNAIIRKLSAVETLGSTTIICSDKTGTLTMNRMTIQQVWAVGHEPTNSKDAFNHDEMRLLEMFSLSSNASIVVTDGEEKEIGDPTETAIIRLLQEKHIDKESLDAIFPRVFELPFDSGRKRMTTVHKTGDLEDDVKYISITKGAFDRIPADATTYCMDTAKSVHDQFADNALRVLAVAYKYYDTLPEKMDVEELENGLTFGGIIGMIDPPRPESKAAVQVAKDAGIKTIMITGDHAGTAAAIASEIGIFNKGDKTLTGVELEAMSDEELAKNIKDYTVYARVSPEDKIRIVKAWQEYDEIVAMTGDGVNDAPALKAADAGVAMGSGTDVSKSASDVVLTDDNFASIVDAIKQGRRAYTNIRKVLCALLACNLSEIFTVLLGLLFWGNVPLVAIQLLFINVVADGVPVLCMCREPAEKDAMKQKPVKKDESIFARGVTERIALYGALFAVISLIAYYVGASVALQESFKPSHEIGMTMAYLVIGLSSVVNIFNVRSFNQSIFTIGITSNMLLFVGACFSFLILVLTATIPTLMNVFYCVPISMSHWLIVIALSVSPLLVGEIHKAMIRNKQRILVTNE
ncbi:MAG: cation-translocating P-type ATPase, partial [Peptococcaceae bacterium]|nr:cation-translocating P-type ATPase [Peptococcaceae bacterium]